MNKVITFIAALLLSVTAHAEPSTNWAKFTNCAVYACNTQIVQNFGVQDWFWAGQVDDESILPLAYGQRSRLWRCPTAITKVVQYATGKTFVQGTDYVQSGCDIVIPQGSSIPLAPAGFTTTADSSSPYYSQSYTKEGGQLYLGNNYSLYQIAVTYQAAPIVSPEPAQLPNLWNKISAHTPVAITFFGDSITAGGVSSSTLNIAPHMPPYDQLFDAYMSTVAPGYVYWRNVSVSGMSSAGAVQAVQGSVNDTPSDVVVIAFGMNDASGNVTKATYKANIKALIDSIRGSNADTEIVLVSGITSNPDWMYNHPRFHAYRGALHELAGAYTGISVVDVTSTWEAVLANHSYYDLTANGVNHPGDFGHKIYVQTLIQALFGSDPQ